MYSDPMYMEGNTISFESFNHYHKHIRVLCSIVLDETEIVVVVIYRGTAGTSISAQCSTCALDETEFVVVVMGEQQGDHLLPYILLPMYAVYDTEIRC